MTAPYDVNFVLALSKKSPLVKLGDRSFHQHDNKVVDEPKEKITAEYLEIAKWSKIIEFVQFLGCLLPGLLRVCALYLVKCQVKKGSIGLR